MSVCLITGYFALVSRFARWKIGGDLIDIGCGALLGGIIAAMLGMGCAGMTSGLVWSYNFQGEIMLILLWLIRGLFFVGGSILGAFRLANATKKRFPAKVA